jgi:IS30 family transposase
MLSGFRFIWNYRPGRNNVADPLSRIPISLAVLIQYELSSSDGDHREYYLEAADSSEMFTTAQLNDGLNEMASSFTQGSSLIKRVLREMRRHTNWLESLTSQYALCKKGMAWYRNDALVVPEISAIRKEIMHGFHDAPYSGHLGVTKSMKAIGRWFWWPGLKADVIQYVRNCDSCQRNKSHNLKQAGLLQPLAIPDQRWSSISLDFITGLQMTTNGHNAILVFVDRLSKMVHFVPTTTNASAEDTARLFVDNVLKLHGLPRDIVSDRGTVFTSNFWTEVCRLLTIKQSMSTAYHPQRVNRVLEDFLRHYVNPTHTDWDQ